MSKAEKELSRLDERIVKVEEQESGVQCSIRSVEDSIRSVEDSIRSVEDSIRSVEDRIRSVEDDIRNCSDGDERKLLRAEKLQLQTNEQQLRTRQEQLQTRQEQLQTRQEQLQTEKQQLQTRQEQLQTEKQQLLALQLRDQDLLGTEHEWLVQKVVELAFPSEASSGPSTSNKDRFWIPLKVEYWDVKDNIEAYVESADNRKRVYDLFVTSSTERIQNFQRFGTDFVSHILSALVDFMNKKKEPLFVLTKEGSLKKEDYDGMDVDGGAFKKGGFPVRVDYLVTFGGKTCFPVEIKNGGLGPHEGASWKLHEVWAKYTSREGNDTYCEDSGIRRYHCVKVLRCICQLYEYMVLAKVGYGVLTDANYWYILKRDNAGCLKISPGFKASDEPSLLLAALSYLVNSALGDDMAYSNQPVNGHFPTLHGGVPSGSSDESLGDIRGAGTNDADCGVHRSERFGVDENRLVLEDDSPENLNIKCLSILSCDGWSGFVFNGQLNGKPVALKFADLGTRRAEALVHEVKAYAKMEKLWGRVVPELVGHGVANSSRCVYVATELLEGSELGDVAVTKEVETAALEALDAIHACGLLHGDISPKNIMVVREKQPSVRFLDFGFSCFDSKKRLQKAERKYLEQLLVHLREQRRE